MVQVSSLPRVTLIFLLSLPVGAQIVPTLSPVQQMKAKALEKQAMSTLDQVLNDAKGLSLPQNRIAIESAALSVLWQRDEARARSLVTQIVSDFAEAAGQKEEGSRNFNLQGTLFRQRQQLVQLLASQDPQSALDFLLTTRSYVKAGSPTQEQSLEHQLELNIASFMASKDPQRALQMAESKLQQTGDIPWEIVDVMNSLRAKDENAAAKLFGDIVSRLKDRDLTSNRQNFQFAVNLINTNVAASTADPATIPQPDTPKDITEHLTRLADTVVSAALSPLFPSDMLSNLQYAVPALQKLVPAKAPRLQQRLADYNRTLPPGQRIWNKFSQAQQGANPDELLALAAQAPPDFRGGMYQQIVLKFANQGDFLRAQRIATEDVQDPAQRNQMMQQVLQQAAGSAWQKGQFGLARQLTEQITPTEQRATSLAQLALNVANGNQPSLARDILEEASSLIQSPVQDLDQFRAQLEIARAFARFNPARSVQLLERAAGQLNQVLAAAAQVDGFMPFNRSFIQGDLLLDNGLLYDTVVQEYAQSVAALATYDFDSARSMAGRLDLPEARIMTELIAAQAVLNQQQER